jgi:hypothetical protein
MTPSEPTPRFCPFCDVTMDLHPDVDPGDLSDTGWACGIAGQKADLLESFGRLVS